VPSGIVATCASLLDRTSPLTTSLSVPSPPTETSRSAPSRAARSASSISWRGCSERYVSPSSPSCAARCASCGQRFPVAPLPDAGLTRKAVLMAGSDRREPDAGHPVDGGAQLVVGDPLELALDDDVAHREQAPCLHLAQRAEREKDCGLHLDAE